MLALALAAGVQLASAAEGRNASISGAKKAARAKIGYLDNAQGIISQGYGEARKTTKEYSDKAQTYQDPYVELGLNAKKYFTNLDTNTINNKMNQYLSNADPLMNYADKITSKALNAKLAALGRTDSGNAINQDLDRSTKLAYEFSNLANTRLQQEIATQQNLLSVGQGAANNSTQLQYNTGNQLSNLFTNEAQLNAAYEAEKGGAASDMESIIGNANANYWGNVGGMAGTAIGSLQEVAKLGAAAATGGASTAVTGVPGVTPQGGAQPAGSLNMPVQNVLPTNKVPATQATLNMTYLPTTGNISTTYYNNSALDSVPPMSSQNYYTYNPYQQTYRGY